LIRQMLEKKRLKVHSFPIDQVTKKKPVIRAWYS